MIPARSAGRAFVHRPCATPRPCAAPRQTPSLRGRSYSTQSPPSRMLKPHQIKPYDCSGPLCSRDQIKVTLEVGACNCMRKDHMKYIRTLAQQMSPEPVMQEQYELEFFYTVPLPNGICYLRARDMVGC